MATRRSPLFLLVLVGLLAFAGQPPLAVAGGRFPRPIPLDPVGDLATMYRGNAARTGEFPGPGPQGPPTFLWRVGLGEVWGTPGVGDGLVVTRFRDGLIAVDRVTGAERWRQSLAPSSSSPAVSGGMVYVGTWGEGLHAIDAATGEVVWRFLTGDEAEPDGPPASAFDSSPAIADGVVYVGEGPSGGVYALDAATGDERWRFVTHGGTPGSPAVADGTVFFTTETVFDPDEADTTPSRLYAVDAATGAERWHVDLGPGETSFSSPAVADGGVYVGVTAPETNTGYWLAVDAATGLERWRFPTPTSGTWNSSPAIGDGLVYVSGVEDFTLYALDAESGEEVWSFKTGGGLYAPPAIAGVVVYVHGNFDPRLVALNATSGQELWALPVGGGSSSAIVDGKIYVSGAGHLYAISSKDDPAAVEFPARPEPPAAGPGSPNTRFPGSRATHFGPDPGGFWIVEPTTGPSESDPVATDLLPLVLALPGCCGPGDYTVAGDQMDYWRHVARQGHVVVLPVYRADTIMEDVDAAMRAALAEFARGDHPGVDATKVAVIGHSFGGPAALVYAANAQTEGLPVPSAVFVANPCEGNAEGNGCVAVPADLAMPAGIKVLVLVGDQDFVVGAEPAKRIWTALGTVPPVDRDFVTMVSDDHGHLPFVADHNVIGAASPDLGAVYGFWKLSDALLACAFAGDFCQYALGDTPEQRFMGTWSDGTPVAELRVTDDPLTLEATSATTK
jgi:outer membrane protein assembly factor BamB